MDGKQGLLPQQISDHTTVHIVYVSFHFHYIYFLSDSKKRCPGGKSMTADSEKEGMEVERKWQSYIFYTLKITTRIHNTIYCFFFFAVNVESLSDLY